MIRKKRLDAKPIIDLTGPQGNAFVLMGMAHRWAAQLNLDWEPIEQDMKSGDYNHLLEVLEKHFGKYVIFEK